MLVAVQVIRVLYMQQFLGGGDDAHAESSNCYKGNMMPWFRADAGCLFRERQTVRLKHGRGSSFVKVVVDGEKHHG